MKKIILFVLAIFLFSACEVGDGINLSSLIGTMDLLKINQYQLIMTYESSFETAAKEKKENQLIGVTINDKYNNFLNSISSVKYLFEEVWKYKKDELNIQEYYKNSYLPEMDKYLLFIEDLNKEILTTSMTKELFDQRLKELDKASEDFFYIHTNLLSLVFKKKWNSDFFMVKDE